MRAVYQLPNNTSHRQRRLWRAVWVLFVCRPCYGRKYAPWGVTYGK